MPALYFSRWAISVCCLRLVGQSFNCPFLHVLDFYRRCTFGRTQRAHCIQLYLLPIPNSLWATIAGLQDTDGADIDILIENIWLFCIDGSVTPQPGIGTAWVYWTLYDFRQVDHHAFKNATTNVVLLVIIVVFNLPIYVTALTASLGVPVV